MNEEENIIEAEVEEIKPKAWHKYWSWKQWRKKDDWTPLKKNGRKKWTVMIQEAQVSLEVGTIVNYLTYWKTKIENKENKALKIKPNTALTVQQACREYWIHPNTFYDHLRKFPAIKEKYELMKEDKREYIRSSAEDNIERALTGWLDLSDKELVDASFKMLEKTDKAYNPKTEIETKSIGINLSKKSENLKQDLLDILWA